MAKKHRCLIILADYEKLRDNVIAAWKELSMDAHRDRLLDFYEDIKKS